MVTHVDEINTPPTPADAPEIFEQRASQVWSDLARAVPQMNQQALENNSAAYIAEAAKVRSTQEAGLAFEYKNNASASKLEAQIASSAADQAKASALLAKTEAELARDAARDYAASINPDAWNARFAALENRKRALGDGQSRSTGRVANTTYTNATGSTILIEVIAATNAANAWIGLNRNGEFVSAGHAPAWSVVTASSIILHGETWSVVYDAGSIGSIAIKELS